MWVAEGDHLGLDGSWEGFPPKVWLWGARAGWSKENTAHATFCCITSTDNAGIGLGNQLIEPGWPSCKVLDKITHIVKEIMELGCEANAVFVLMPEGFLKQTETPAEARHS